MECIVGGKGERLAGTIDLGRDARRLGARVVADSGPLSIWPECLGGGIPRDVLPSRGSFRPGKGVCS